MEEPAVMREEEEPETQAQKKHRLEREAQLRELEQVKGRHRYAEEKYEEALTRALRLRAQLEHAEIELQRAEASRKNAAEVLIDAIEKRLGKGASGS